MEGPIFMRIKIIALRIPLCKSSIDWDLQQVLFSIYLSQRLEHGRRRDTGDAITCYKYGQLSSIASIDESYEHATEKVFIGLLVIFDFKTWAIIIVMIFVLIMLMIESSSTLKPIECSFIFFPETARGLS